MLEKKQAKVRPEFIVLMASLMSLVALSIDAVLPALPEIGHDLSVVDPVSNQLVITMIFLGLGFGQLIFGPLSDSFGRKPMVYFGFGIFVLGSILCISTSNFSWMIFGRILQGVGLSSPRTISIAMVRDTFSGNHMAKVLSIIVVFFILVPVVAPAFGQLILNIGDWKMIFLINLALGLGVVIWFWQRQPETLVESKKIKFTFRIFYTGTREFLRHKDAVAFTLISGFITGSFMVYLSTSQQIYEQQYHLGDLFPYLFAISAISVGAATLFNSQVVMKLGPYKLSLYATIAYTAISLLYVVLFNQSDNPSIFILLSFFLFQFFAIGLLFGNLRALAMEPLGHIAGIGSAINGFVSTVMAVPIANYIGSFVDSTVLPLFIGFTIFGMMSIVVFIVLRGKKSKDRLELALKT